jgi:hypothetical protein
VKLDGFDREVAMTNSHNNSVLRLGRDLQARGKLAADCVKLMITTDLKSVGQTFENAKPSAQYS